MIANSLIKIIIIFILLPGCVRTSHVTAHQAARVDGKEGIGEDLSEELMEILFNGSHSQ